MGACLARRAESCMSCRRLLQQEHEAASGINVLQPACPADKLDMLPSGQLQQMASSLQAEVQRQIGILQ